MLMGGGTKHLGCLFRIVALNRLLSVVVVIVDKLIVAAVVVVVVNHLLLSALG